MDLPRRRGDRSKLTRVLVTLLDNAQKDTGAEGQIRVTAVSVDECVQIDISNNGVAIPKQERERVFVVLVEAGEGLENLAALLDSVDQP